MALLVGIDYSMSCPAICYLTDDNVQIHWVIDKAKYQINLKLGKFHFIGHDIKEWKHPLERYNNLANTILETQTDFRLSNADNINIEDYSMGSKGLIFNIAENTAILKHHLWNENLKYNTIPPTVVKKFATGKGNSKKEQMYDAWLKDTGIDLMKLLDCNSEKIPSPISDIVDAYYLAKLDKWTK